ncbi:Protein of unknown function [Nakamurella panacisegetis]|uniref:Glucose/arabinose dehydrogenase, beta-propeller fold n=2 Tax=Nakamurella panacisegetis TaxID=1090615 RepID=A0A1H0HNG8_9ACTN|nr:Protein of unknown function [Nakamurella panacisegetis]
MTHRRWNGKDAAASGPFHLLTTARRLMALCLVLALSTVGSVMFAPAATAAPVAAGPRLAMHADDEPTYKVLVFSKTAGFRHTDGIAAGIAQIQALGVEHHFAVDATEDAAAFTAANLAQYSTVIFLSTTSPTADALLTAAQRQAFQAYIEGGGGFFGIHAASDANYDWPWYGGLVGGYFKQHPAIQTASLLLEDRVHPANAGLGESISLTEEWYDFQANPRNKVHVLASVDTRSYSGSTMGLDHPISWCQDYEGGRSAYTALGHDATNWSKPWFQQMVLGSIETTAGVVAADCGASVPGNYEVVSLDNTPKNPMMLDIAADKRVFFIELAGALKMVDPATQQTSTVATLPVFTANESGLLGMALDPGFASNHYIYLYYSPTGVDVDRLSRFTVSADYTSLGAEKVLVDVPVQRAECCHHGGSLAFDRNSGNLYLATGDNTNPFASDGYSPTDYRSGRAFWDASRSSGNTNSLSGKVLRIHPEADGTYTVPDGNLFAAGTAKTKPEIYAMGFRNPFRINIDPNTGHLLVADYGPDASSDNANRGPGNTVEWNIVDTPGNYGWPFCTGNNAAYKRWNFANSTAGTAYECATGPVNDSPNNTGLTTLPAAIPADIYYHYSAGTDFPEIGGGGAPMAGAVYDYDESNPSDTKWPAYWDGKPLLAEWNNNTLYSILTDAAMTKVQKVTPVTLHQLPAPATRSIKMMDSKFGPDGSLYMIDWGGGWSDNTDAGIYRIDYVHGDRAPVAKASADVTAGSAPLDVTFSSAGSADPDGDTLTYAWAFGDGGTSTEANPSHTFARGQWNVQLTVTDSTGRTGVSNVRIVSGNARPVVTITGPKDGGFFEFGDQLTYTATVTDAEDGSTQDQTISCDLVKESSQLGHYSGGSAHAHPMDETTGCTATVQTLGEGGHGGDVHLFWIIEVSYTDKGNGDIPPLTGSASVTLQMKHRQAEHFTESGRIPGTSSTGDPGVKIETTSDPAGGTSNIGFIEPGDWFSYDRVNLTDITALSMRVAGTVGADFEIRWNDPVNGQLLGTVPAKPTTGWQDFTDTQTALTNVPTETGTIYLVATKAGQTGSVVNVNWVDFIGKGATSNERPVISSASVSPTSGIAPVTVDLASAATDPEGTPVSYSWDMGTTDGATVKQANGSYTFTVPGTYTVKLTATDAGGGYSTKSFTVRVNAPAESCLGDKSDDFDGSTLSNGRWSVVRGDQTMVVAGGNLRIPASTNDLYGTNNTPVSNIVLQSMPAGAWQATTKVNVQAYTSYQQAGLILYTDDDNYAKFVVQGRTSSKDGRVIQFAHEVGGSAQESNSAALGADFPDTVYLRLTSDGTTLTPSYSVDGSTYTTPDQSWSGWNTIRKTTATLGTPKVGLVAFANTSGTVTNADFDWFRLTPDSTATASTPNDEFNGSSVETCRWTVLRSDPSLSRVTGGNLQLDTIAGELGVAKNVTLQKQPAGNHWTIETKVDGSNFTGNYQQVGLVDYVDGDNFVKLDFIRDSATGRRIELRSNVAGSFVQPQPNSANLTTDVWYLRLERQDNAFAGYYSADGITWTKFADTVANIPAASDGLVGVYASGVNQTSSATALIDYFHVVGADTGTDTTAPVTAATTNPAAPTGQDGWYVGDVGLTLTATDSGDGASGVDQTRYQLDAGAEGVYGAPLVVTGDGTHTVKFRSVDKAGNDEAIKTVAIKIDSTAPTTVADVSTDNPAKVILTATDPTSGVQRTEYRLDGGEWTTYAAPFTVVRTGADQNLEFRSTDKAGNAEITASVVITKAGDTTAPLTAAALNPAQPNGQNGWYTSPIELKLSATDGDSGVASTEYALGDGAWTAYTGPVLIDLEGAQSVQFRSTDKAGNVEAAKNVVVKLDATAPVAAANLDGDQVVVVTLVSSDDASGVAGSTYRVAGGAWKAYAGPFTITRTSAAQLVEFRSTDKAGNASAIRTVTVAPAQVVLKPSVTTLTVSPAWAPFGSKVTAAITVVSAGTLGSELVTLYDGSTIIGAGVLKNGKVSVAISDLTVGAHSLTARFAGNANVAESASPAKVVTIDKATAAVALKTDKVTQTYGTRSPATLTATVTLNSKQAVAGRVQFKDGSAVIATAPVVSGVARVKLSQTLAVGSHRFTATFLPTDTASTGGATSQVVTVKVVKAVSKTLLKANRSSQKVGQTTTFTAGVSLDTKQLAVGVVRFAVNGKKVATVTASKGSAAYVLPKSTKAGSYKVTATFVPSSAKSVSGSVSSTVVVKIVK